MKPKVFRVAGEKRYGYQVYGLSKDGTLRSSNWWDTPEEAQENIKRIFNIDMAQESTRGNTKMKRRRIIKERSFSSDEELLIKQALEAAIKAKQLLDDAAGTIRDAVGETFLFARLDSHSMDLDDTIDDIKAVLAGQIDATDDEYVPESRKRFGSKFVKESCGSKWFNEYGFLKKRIPSACIKACSGSGNKDEALKTWVYNMQFFIPDNLLDQAIDYLREYGAYDENTLQKWKNTEDINHNIAQYVLWNFCCDVAEGNLRQSELYLGH